MATRYSKRQVDGSIEYYDSREEMEAANPSVSLGDILKAVSSSFNPFVAFVGFIVVGVAALRLASGFSDWPTWIRFIGIFCAATIGGFVSGKLGNALFMFLAVLLGASIVYGLGYAVWHLL